jgi:hypothetical protein
MPRENIGGYWRPQFFDQGDRFWLLSALYLGGAKVDIIQSGRYPFDPVHLAVVPGAPKVNV